MAENENGVAENAEDVTAETAQAPAAETAVEAPVETEASAETQAPAEVEASAGTEASAETQVSAEDGAAESGEEQASQFNASTPAPTTSREFAAQGELVDALSASGDENEGEAREVEGGRNYEMVYISRVGDAEATENTTKRLRELVEGASGAIDNVRNSETRRLAYPIGGEIEGIYVVANGRFAPGHIGEVDRFFKLEENVIRHMILRQDD